MYLKVREKRALVEPYEVILWVAIISVLYLISLSNYLLFHTLVELFSVYVAYIIFIIVWKSKGSLENRYLVFMGIAYFFIGTLDLLYTLSYYGMGVFPGLDPNMNMQFWVAARYMESVSFLLAPLLLTDYNATNQESDKFTEGTKFAWKVFIGYAGITIICLLSIFVFRNFPDSFAEGSGFTPFKIMSGYLICLILLCSLIALYTKKDRFETHVFKLLGISIILTILGELSLNSYPNPRLLDLAGHCFKVLSFYLIYKAIVETGFEDPFSLLFRELKQSEEALRQESIFLKDDQGHIYRMLGVKTDELGNEPTDEKLEIYEKGCSPSLQSIEGIMTFLLDENSTPVLMEGAVEQITGYTKEDFLSGNITWTEIIIPLDQSLFLKNMKEMISNPDISTEMEYRIRRKDGEIKWVLQILQKAPQRSGTAGKVQGLVRDITKRKLAEETLSKMQETRIKEIHHRIKNNLQVISSLLSLQAEKFTDPKTLEAFRESQNRVISMALIHEELYEGKGVDTIDFSAYLQKLTAELFSSYTVKNENLSLKLDLEEINLEMDIAIPLGIIVNELVSNSLKHAFPSGEGGEISIKLHRDEYLVSTESSDTREKSEKKEILPFVLTVIDNGKGIPEEIDFRNSDSLGLQLVIILVEQIDGCIELDRTKGTKFIILFGNIESTRSY